MDLLKGESDVTVLLLITENTSYEQMFILKCLEYPKSVFVCFQTIPGAIWGWVSLNVALPV